MDEKDHRFACRVYYEDVDMGGIVYHANYLKYIERARSDWVRGLGLDQLALRDAGLVFAVSRIEADFARPARFDDALDVITSPLRVTGARILLRQQVWREGAVLFSALVTLAMLDARGRAVRLPAEIRRLGR